MTPARRQPRGSIYMAVLGASAMISLIALTALLGLAISRRAASEDADFSEARILARSGIELGVHYISTDPYWRTNRGNGAWATNVPIGRGTFSLSAVDPIDNDVTLGDNDPVILTSTGIKGNAVCKMSVRLEVGVKTGSCLEVSACANDNFNVGGGTLTSNQTISSNNQMSTGGGATVNANVEWYRQIGGSGYTGSTKQITNMRVLPDPVHVFDSYVAAGTPISYTALPQATQPELIANGKFETNVTGWYVLSGHNITVAQDGSNWSEGAYSMKVSHRNGVTDVAAQDLPLASAIKDHIYTLQMSIFPKATCTIQATLRITTSNNLTYYFSTPAVSVLYPNTWNNLQGTVIPTGFDGNITKATVYLTTTDQKNDYNMDKVSLKDVTYQNNTYYIDRVLLSPQSNPYGATNTNGIYILDCGGQNVAISNSRIVGTLVLKNAHNPLIQGSINWEPALPNYPALMCDDAISISCTATPLDEAGLNVNFDPAGCPYPYAGGISNTTYIDTYPSQIRGIIYSAKDINFVNQNNVVVSNTIIGNVTANGKTTVQNSTLNLTYSNVFYNTPAPGFDVGRVPLYPVPGTWKRTAQ